ncbi:ankyrin repeat domain-containing protein 39 [Octopus bimaculoides]|uniref:ankyrin repeat domain-containing protein 39 n=1 Tax=Octopus bimaculoides TaxID=37653 RepID=UPI00071C46EF|nr:ankyrin repeat domain-containing protein 39 [Octopus bimaculoides]|eukprot:XP_014767550.1 PREDICTED: ankyrin repeat domain-containing protein 39-like [Octopus bimaculoides]
MNNFRSCNCLQNNTNNSKTSSTTVNSNNSNFQRLSGAEQHVCCQSPSLQPSLHQTLPELDFERGLWNDAVTGDIQGIRLKLEKQRYGCTANATDTSGYTPLHYASRSGHLEICKLLVEHGANVNCTTASGLATPLHRAAYSGHSSVVKFLLDKGADPFKCDADGRTALHKAAVKSDADIISLLLHRYPQLHNITDNNGFRAKHCLPEDKSTQLLDLFP